ncbi:MAG: hypothetical protein AAF915_02000 [Cyanobacteria bacterium P01_D01_bin.50]
MSKALYITGWFLAGCSASGIVAWFGALHPPNTMRISIALYSLVTVVWVLCWVADDAIAPFVKALPINYYAALIAFAASILLGSVSVWLTL